MELLDDYTKATFPLELPWGDHGKVRLLAAFENGVIGASYGTYERDGVTRETISQAIIWDGQGLFAEGQYEGMNLPPPPAKVAEKIAALEDEMASAQGRLDGMPDAPAEWRGVDERRIAAIIRQLSKLRGEPINPEPPTPPAAPEE